VFQAAVPAEEYQRGKNAYDRGEYGRAVEIIQPLLYPEIRLQSEHQIVHAHRILGVSYLFEGQEPEATREFRKLLQMNPEYKFDPLLDPPEVVDFFNGVRKDYGSELAQLEKKRKEAELARKTYFEECEKVRAGPSVIERRFGRNSFTISFIPFGAGQFQNGHRKKGWAFLTAESVLAAVSVGAFATNLAVYGLRPRRTCRYDVGDAACPPEMIDHTDENRSRWLTRVQMASGALFFGTVIWGILDAIYYYQPETLLGLASPMEHPSATQSLRVSPFVTDRAVGTGLSFRF
jgi:tetratricopeptide (TPR) repeat protein